MRNDKVLFIIRGVAGAGKSTLADIIAPNENYAADMYFGKFCDGKFQPRKLRQAHAWCKSVVEDALAEGVSPVAVANTFTRQWEMQEYLDMGERYGYTVFSIIVENRHGNVSLHQVPEETVDKMRERFEVSL